MVNFNMKDSIKIYEYYPDHISIVPFRNDGDMYSFMLVEMRMGIEGETIYTHKAFEFETEQDVVKQVSKRLHLLGDMMITMSN